MGRNEYRMGGNTIFRQTPAESSKKNQAAPRRHWMSAWRRMIIDMVLTSYCIFDLIEQSCLYRGWKTVGNANHPFFCWFQHYIIIYAHIILMGYVCVKRCQWCHGDTWWHHPEGKHTYVIYVLSKYSKMPWHRIMCFFQYDMWHVHIHTHVHR